MKLLWTFFLISLVDGYEDDTEHKCQSPTERVWFLKTYVAAKSGYRRYVANCGDLQLKDKLKGVQCELRKPLKCDGSNEGCGENEWIGGFRATDVGLPVKIMQLFCCKADNLKTVECATTTVLSVPGGSGELKADPDQYLSLTSCSFVNGKDSKVNETQLTMSKCVYSVEDSKGKSVVLGDSNGRDDSSASVVNGNPTPTPIINIPGEKNNAKGSGKSTTAATPSTTILTGHKDTTSPVSPKTTSATTDTDSKSACCPNDWIVYNSNCHYVVTRAKSFNDAQRYCKALEAELFVPSGELEMKDVISHATLGQLNWVGIKANSTGVPGWVGNISPLPLDSLSWLVKAPPTYGSSPPSLVCVASLATSDPRNFYLHYYDCNGQHNFICTHKISNTKRVKHL